MDALPNPGIYGRIAAWPTGGKIDLAAQFPEEYRSFGTSIAGDFGLTKQFNQIYNSVRSVVYNSISPVNAWTGMIPQSMRMYSYFDMLPQPVFLKDQPGTLKEGGRLHFNRWLGRETDCSDWFIRPCVMIIATIENAPLPIPVEIDGETPESSGTVILRWIHELPVDDRFVPGPVRSLKPFVVQGGAP